MTNHRVFFLNLETSSSEFSPGLVYPNLYTLSLFGKDICNINSCSDGSHSQHISGGGDLKSKFKQIQIVHGKLYSGFTRCNFVMTVGAGSRFGDSLSARTRWFLTVPTVVRLPIPKILRSDQKIISSPF